MIKRILSGFAILASFAALIFRGKASRVERDAANERANREREAREYERAGSEAMVDGLNHESEVQREGVDTARRDHFE